MELPKERPKWNKMTPAKLKICIRQTHEAKMHTREKKRREEERTLKRAKLSIENKRWPSMSISEVDDEVDDVFSECTANVSVPMESGGTMEYWMEKLEGSLGRKMEVLIEKVESRLGKVESRLEKVEGMVEELVVEGRTFKENREKEDVPAVPGIFSGLPTHTPYAFALAAVSVLFMDQELSSSLLFESAKSQKPGLDQTKVEMLLGELDLRFKDKWDLKILKSKINQKCRDIASKLKLEKNC